MLSPLVVGYGLVAADGEWQEKQIRNFMEKIVVHKLHLCQWQTLTFIKMKKLSFSDSYRKYLGEKNITEMSPLIFNKTDAFKSLGFF